MSGMTEKKNSEAPRHDFFKSFVHKFDFSAALVIVGVILLFLTSILTIMIAPMFIDDTWISPSSPYQVQMYEVEDPNIYIGSAYASGFGGSLQSIHRLEEGFTLLAFKESESDRIVGNEELEKYITRYGDRKLILTSRLLLLRTPEGESKKKAESERLQLQKEPEERIEKAGEGGLNKPNFRFLEIYDPGIREVFACNPEQGVLQNWVDRDFIVLDETERQPYHGDPGVVYVQNPQEYRTKVFRSNDREYRQYDPEGVPVRSLADLTEQGLHFRSRKELIALGEHIYAIEGCWYCHTDQTRTLIQDTVLNGSDSYPAPPSSANEYIYQKITFPGTRRIGPDLSRVGIKRPSRDWHKGHFWAPKTASAGSIMPAFQHFFDADPRGTGKSVGIPNYRFEAIYQYLMTKGTRITAPTQAWWLGRDPIKTKEIIEGKRRLQ